jgi:hypothetical protein
MKLRRTGVLVAIKTAGTIFIYRKSTYLFHTSIRLCFPGSVQSLLIMGLVFFFVFMVYFKMLLQKTGFFNVEYQDEWRIMKWKRFKREAVVA